MASKTHHFITRPIWVILGAISLGLGVIGIVLPVLPTTPFVLLAAFCFGKGSPRMRQWLENHPTFGKPILTWEDHGAIAPRHKRMAAVMMAATFGLSLVLGLPTHVLIIQAVCLGGAALFVLTRPNGPQ